MVDTPEGNDSSYNYYDPDNQRDEYPHKEDRFDLYPDQDLVTIIDKGKLDNICERFQELSMLASIVLDTSVDELEREDVLEFIQDHR